MVQPDPRVLGQILLLHSALPAAPNSQTMGEQVCHVLRFVPGLAGCGLWVNHHLVACESFGETEEIWRDALLELKAGHRISSSDIEVIPLQTSRQKYGDLIAAVSNWNVFKAYVPYLQNTANLVALILENWSQAAELEALNAGLEEQVCQRTQELRESEERFRMVIQASNDGIWDWNLKTNDIFYSPRWKEMLGYADSELANNLSTWLKVMHPDDLVVAQRLLQEHFEKGTPFTHISRCFCKDGSIRWVQANGFALRDEAGVPYRVVGNHRDITGEKIAEEALKQAKETAEAANSAKDQFIAVLSHELRTPLTPVMAAVTSLDAESQLPDQIRSDMEVIRRNVELEARLIDDLLDITRISHGKVTLRQEIVDAHACLRAVFEICQSEIDAKQMEVSLDLQAAEHHVWADSSRLRQVLWNLLQNAVKFTPEHGRISLRTMNAEGRLRLEVSDTGIGIEPELLPLIFNFFQQGEQKRTRRFGGLGLGLSIAKAIVEMHQGTLAAESKGKGEGATFTVELPVISVVAESPITSPASAPSVNNRQKILLVEDHPDTLQILSRLLRKRGYEVVTADSVRTALEQAASEPFDLLVSDLGLADGTGLEIMRQVKARHGLRGIALSGFGTDEDIRQSRMAGFEAHLVKPIDFQALLTAVQQMAV